jgi:uncharacterized protein (DUF849 family)
MSPHLPVTPEEIATDAIEAAEAGASIVHIHVRDPETGKPITDLDLFRDVAGRIQAESDVIVQPTTGGAPTMDPEERVQVIPTLSPEMASCNQGSLNIGLYPMLERYDEFEYDWEREYLEESWKNVFQNTFHDLRTMLPVFDEHGTKPELECYDVGHLYNARHLVDRGLLDLPVHLQFVMGLHGGIGATENHLTHLVTTAEELFDDEFSFSVIGAGKKQFQLGLQAVSMGGHVRVGLEDSLYIRKGELATSNAEQVEKIVRLADEVAGRDPATPAETRAFLGLKGKEKTAVAES